MTQFQSLVHRDWPHSLSSPRWRWWKLWARARVAIVLWSSVGRQGIIPGAAKNIWRRRPNGAAFLPCAVVSRVPLHAKELFVVVVGNIIHSTNRLDFAEAGWGDRERFSPCPRHDPQITSEASGQDWPDCAPGSLLSGKEAVGYQWLMNDPSEMSCDAILRARSLAVLARVKNPGDARQLVRLPRRFAATTRGPSGLLALPPACCVADCARAMTRRAFTACAQSSLTHWEPPRLVCRFTTTSCA